MCNSVTLKKFRYLSNHEFKPVQNMFINPQEISHVPCSQYSFPPLVSNSRSSKYTFCLYRFGFAGHFIQEPFMIQFSMSCFFSFNVMFLRSTHEVVCIRSSLLFLHEQYSAVWIHHILFFHSSTEPYNMKSFVTDFFHITYDSKVHLHCSISFLLLLNDIPLYGYGIFICSSVYGDLSCNFFGYYEKCCHEHSFTRLCVDISFHLYHLYLSRIAEW